tara:strand:+ start:2075 stop:3118 length:1044 start_codon:yes stop_codon:yes gene_type:complete
MPALDRPFSYSQFSCKLRCGKLWEYRYKQGLTSIRPSVALRMGSLVDSGLEGALVGREEDTGHSCAKLSTMAVDEAYGTWAEGPGVSHALAMSSEFQDEANETRANAINVAKRVVRNLELDTSKWETARDKSGRLGVQYEVKHTLRAHEPGFIGLIDWVPKRQGTWIVDLKVRKAFDDDEALRWDYQLSTYEHTVGNAFGRIAGVAHYQTKSKPTTPPSMTKKGKLSKAKSQSCDWPTYLDTIRQLGLPQDDYTDMKDGLPKFEQWTWTRRSRVELRNTWQNIELMAERLVEAHHDTRPQPRVLDSLKCKPCDMRHLCIAELKGQDHDHIRATMYQVRTDYGPTTNQ